MLFCTPAPGMSHAGIVACCDLTGLGAAETHDILSGHVAVPTDPTSTYLDLSELEQTRGWLQQAEQIAGKLKRRGSTRAELAEARRQVARLRLEVRHAELVEALGPLDGGRTLEFDWDDYTRYEVRDADDEILFHVSRNATVDDIRRVLAVYDSAYAAGLAKGLVEGRAEGREQVRAPILSALGLLDVPVNG